MERDEFGERMRLLGFPNERIEEIQQVVAHTTKERDAMRATIYAWAEAGLSYFQIMSRLYPAVPQG